MAEYSPEELIPPVWLDEQFFDDILRSAENDPSIQVRNRGELRPATNPGDNFCSVMFRTTVRYTSNRQPDEQAMNLVIKCAPTVEGFKKEMTKDNSLFLTEIKMYSEVLPAMSRLLNDVGEHLEIPRLIHASTQPNTVVVLEDVSPRGWLPGRKCIESLEEARFSTRNIAMFHATSLYLHETTMDLSAFDVKPLMTYGPVLAIFTRGYDEFCNAIDKWQGCEEFAKKLKYYIGTLQERLQRVYTANAQSVGYNVLNHGDFQWKNVMHKRDSVNRIVDSMLIDYQCCHWGSPAIDVLYLIDLIVDNQTKTAYRDEILHDYHYHFARILKKIGFPGKIPSLLDLKIELLRKGFLELTHITVFEPFKHMQLTESSFDEYNDGKLSNPCLENEKFRDMFLAELRSLMYKGFLDEI